MRKFSWMVSIVGMAVGFSAQAQLDRVTAPVPPAMANGLDIVTTRDGGCVVAGSDQGVVGGPMGAVRFDAGGNVVWERKYFAAFPNSDERTAVIFSIQRCRDEGYIMAAGLGYYGGEPDDFRCRPLRLALIRINEDGEVMWMHRFEGLGYYRNVDMQVPFPGVQVRELEDGSFVAVGTTNAFEPSPFADVCVPACPAAYTGVMARFDRGGAPIFIHRIAERGAGIKSRICLADLSVERDVIVVFGSVQRLWDCSMPDPAGTDLLLFTTDWNGNVLASYSYDTVNPLAPCNADPCPQNEWASSISIRDGAAYIGANYPESRVRISRCANYSDSLVASIDYWRGRINWAYLQVDAWISYATLKFDAEDGEILFGGTRIPHDMCDLHAYASKWSVAGGPIWYQNYFDPRTPGTLFDIEAIHSGPESRFIWMSGTQDVFTGPQLYLLGTDHNGKSECSSRESRMELVRPRIRVQERPLELERLAEEEIRVRYPKYDTYSLDPCRFGVAEDDAVTMILAGDVTADVGADGMIDFNDVEQILR